MLKKLWHIITGNGKAGRYAGRRILVVEDGEVERRFLERTLERSGYQPILTATGEEGLKAAREQAPDLIFLDFGLPGISGKEVCDYLKKEEATKDIPVIFLTGTSLPKDVVDCFDVGCDYFLAKPISAGTLLKQMKTVFEEAEESQDLPNF